MTFVAPETGQTIKFERKDDGGQAISLTGHQAPIIEFGLEAGQGMICNLVAVMQRDSVIDIRPAPDLPGTLRLLANHAEEASGSITLMTGCAGKAGIFDLEDHGGRLLCPHHALLAAGPGVTVTIYSRLRNAGVDGLDVMQLVGDGWVFARACGNVKHITLSPGEHAVISAMAIAAMSATIDFNPMEAEDGAGFVELIGPGQVWLQSGNSPS